MPAFGRIPEFDEESRRYPIRALLPRLGTIATNIWPCDVILDQGNVGACVGFSWAGELAAEPEVVPYVDNSMGMTIYNRAQLLDDFPETPPEEGSSVLGGAKAVTEAGFMLQYRWGFGLSDCLDALSNWGPGVLGTNWYSGMMDTNLNGYVWPTGSVVGGHAILVRGLDVSREAVLLHNSWGNTWGSNGTAWLKFTALDQLLHEDGEFCIPVLRVHVGDNPVPPPEPTPVPPPEGCLPKSLQRLFR